MRSAALLALGTVLSFAQTAPEFEAASVKAQMVQSADVFSGIPIMRGGPGTSTPGRIHYANVNLLSLLMKAYDLTADQIQGPGWMREDRFAIEAVVPDGATQEQFRHMLQNLLVSRFRLAVRWEDREFKIYRLTVTPGGARLKPSAVREDNEDVSPRAVQGRSAGETDSSGCPILAPDIRASAGRDACTTYVGWSMEEFARLALAMSIANETGKRDGCAIVRDETGLPGRYDFSLRYDMSYHMRRNMAMFAASGQEITSKNTVSIFKAVEPQLGLKIEPTTARLKVLMLDGAERKPSEN